MTSQLLLLLGKSWKTFYRSKGWLGTQCAFTGLLLFIVAIVMYAVSQLPALQKHPSVDNITELLKHDIDCKMHRFVDFPGTRKCLNATNDQVDQCRDDINNSISAIYDKKYKDPCNESETYELIPYFKHDVMVFRALNESAIDIDYIAYSYTKQGCQREPLAYASDQFVQTFGEGSWQICDVINNFHFVAQHFGKMNILVDKESLKQPELPSLLKNQLLKGILMFANVVALFLFCLEAAVEITQESSNLIKDYLLSMGMSRLFYFLHHFIFNFLKAWATVILFTAVTAGFLKSFGLFVFLFTIFSLALCPFISMSLAIGSCFKKPGTTVLVTIIMWITMILTSLMMDANRTSSLSILYSLNPLIAVSFAFDSKRENDLRGELIWFSEVKHAIPQGYYILMLFFDAVFYFFFAVFIDWLVSSCENPLALLIQLVKRNKDRADEESKKALLDYQEKSDDQNPAELIIEGLHKVYSTGQHVVKGIDLRLHKGQVTALLGHNGAGKSTTFSMISGMVVPTKGRIEVHGSESIADRQKLIGFCPQYNPIFPKLTVDEHLDFFARLKGFESGAETGHRVLNILGMGGHGLQRAINLSGGMKRKLCIAISIAADPPIVLLDEPTAGLDPGARRDFEKLLMEWKKDHAILLTTHYTDEAELLADRIFIMAKGRVFCSGSAQYLRKKFDSGYVLSFAVQKESDVERASTELMKIVKEFVPDVSVYKSRGRQFEFKLITDDSTRFVEMFRKIEDAGPWIEMQSYGLSLNKLEQVFLKVGEMTGTVDRTTEVQTALKELIEENDNRVHGPVKIMKQFGHTLLKRLLFDVAHIKSLILILAFIFFVTFSMLRKTDVKMEVEQEEVDWADALFLSDEYRIGVDQSLYDHPKIKNIVKQFGDYLTIDRVSSNISEWYKRESLKRPPVIGVLTRSGNDWTIYVPSAVNDADLAIRQRMGHLPTLEAIAARINNPSLGKMKYGVKQIIESSSPMQDPNQIVEPPFIQFLHWALVILVPFMVIRPVSFLILEKVSNFAHQERLTGVNRVVFLFSSIFYDFLIFLLYFVTLLGTCFAANPSDTLTYLPDVIYLPLLAFFSSELLILLLYRIFASRAKGEILIMILILMNGLIVVGCISGSSKAQLQYYGIYTLCPLFLLNPMVAAMFWKQELAVSGSIGQFSGPVFIIAHYIILFVAFLLVEFRVLRRCKRKKTYPAYQTLQQTGYPNTVPPTSDINSSVPRDPNAVAAQQSIDDYVLRVNNLEKRYGQFAAVRGISFGVRSHECFGVLGVNGAGKSSTFEVLTGNALPDGGSASVGGVDCSAAPQIGYCPQADAIMDDLTGRQSLVILAALHGYTNPRKVADIVITCVGMQEHANKKSKRYSGGQRRKISVAASLLAQNSLIILDEPTAGIDPIARRDIWSVICALREQTNTAIVLTSHSMDEVEALVSNLIIMRTGSIVVEGSPQMIKNQYGDHYSFNLTIGNGANVGEITSHVLSVFPTASLYDSASLRNIKYRIPRHNGDVFSSIFEKAAALADQLNATDFCFTQATLEDAFMLAAAPPVQQDPALAMVPVMGPPVVPGTVSSTDPAVEPASQPEQVQNTAKEETMSSTQSDDEYNALA